MRTKLIFNSILFFAAGFISILRTETAEIIISLSFAVLFLTLTMLLKGFEKNVVAE